MNWLRRFASFWYEFIVGDDWLIAVGVVVGLVVAGVLNKSTSAAWVALPVVVVLALIASIRRAVPPQLRDADAGRRDA